MRNLLLKIVIAFSLIHPLYGQDYGHQVNAEKIYLQLDGEVYTLDQTIWFKAIVVNAANHTPTQLSGVLHVELIAPDEKIIKSKLVKIDNGMGNGSFELIEGYPVGRYLIRAYTEWNKNFGEDFVFQEYIIVFPRTPENSRGPISEVTLVEKKPGDLWMNAELHPLLLDSLHRKALSVYIDAAGVRDTIEIKESTSDTYPVDYLLPRNIPWVTLLFKTSNEYTFSKSIVLQKDFLDIQFFPESGELIHGYAGKVGFKAIDYSGCGKFVQGVIVDGEKNMITSFKSNALGMGTFLVHGDTTKTYYARIKNGDITIEYPLPETQSLGNTLSITKLGDTFQVIATSNYIKDDSIYVRIECRGVIQLLVKGKLKNGQVFFRIPRRDLPEGIIAFTLVDKHQQPLAERLVFNQQKENQINISVATDKLRYHQREKTDLQIKTTDHNGDPLDANISLLVINKNQLGALQSTRQNILSYFLLSSELKGEIEHPGYYFQTGTDRQADLDALLLTQGWRRYHYAKRMDSIRFQPEYGLSVSGRVEGGLFKRKGKEGVKLTLMAFGEPISVQTHSTDSLGHFQIELDDHYGEKMEFVIQSADRKGENKEYTITLDEKQSPFVNFQHTVNYEEADSVIHAWVEKQQERNATDDAFRLSSGAINLEEVVVEDYRLTPEREKVMNDYGKPAIVINGEDIRKQEEKWSYGLYSVLMDKFHDKIRVVQTGGAGGYLYAYVQGYRPTFVVIDGIAVPYYYYSLIPQIPPSEVKSFEILIQPNNLIKIYSETFPDANRLGAPQIGSIIAIYTFGGKGLHGALKSPPGISKMSMPVFSPIKEFYSPKYENLSNEDWIKPDLRALIYWQPLIGTDDNGLASTSFCNADNLGEMLVVIEAISQDGRIGYQEMPYTVLKRDH